MLPPIKKWQIASPVNEEVTQALSDYHPILRQVLFNRGIQNKDAANHFLAALPPPGSDSSNLISLSEAVDRITWSIERGKKIVIYGDYDADGVTATALLTQALSSLSADVISYIPNRFDEGYGLNIDAIDTLANSGADLIITVDCGIRSLDEAEFAGKKGMDLIITDHHQPGDILPDALAIINPKIPGSTYPDKELTGVGLAYKLTQELIDQWNKNHEPKMDSTQYLDLVAIGTIADLAPLLNENRSLVRRGINVIQNTRRQGLLSLLGVSGIKPSMITSTDIGFSIAPRLNAAGRLESALDALNLLSTTDLNTAGLLSQKLNIQNRERQELTQKIQESAINQAIEHDPDALVLIAIDPDYNPGVVGLAASRLTERYYRPSIIAHQSTNEIRGSCRSIPEFNITRALDECSDLLERYGGHAAAAGFTIKSDRFEEFIHQIKHIAQREYGGLELAPVLKADLSIQLTDLKPVILDYIDLIQPTGMGNPQVSFVSRDLKVIHQRPVGRDGSHLKLTVTDGIVTYDAIAFRQGHLADNNLSNIDILYHFEVNEFNGQRRLQLNIRDIHYD